MAKYVISPKVINVHISQQIWTKKDKVVFDTEGKFKKDKADIESAYERGFLVLLDEKVEEKRDSKEVEEKEKVIEKIESEKPKVQQPKKREYPKKRRK